MNIADLISAHASAFPVEDAIVTADRTFSFADLDSMVLKCSERLACHRIRAGDLVGITLRRGDPMGMVVTLGLARVGATSMYLPVERSADGRIRECRLFGVTAVVSDSSENAVEGLGFVRFDESEWFDRNSDSGIASVESFYRPGQAWCLHIATGTTGRGLRAVMESHDSIVRQAAMYKAVRLAVPRDRLVLGLPLSVASGLRAAVRTVANGATLIFPKSEATHDVVAAARDHGATQAHLTQIHVRKLLDEPPVQGGVLPDVKKLILGGFATPPELIEEIAARISPNIQVFYGATEIGVISFASLAMLRQSPGSVGKVVPGLEVQVVDQDDRPVAVGDTGILRIRGVALPDSYHRNVTETRRVFRGGWVYPGDMGSVDATGYIRIESRVDDFVKIGGHPIYLSKVDDALCGFPGVREAAAFAVVRGSGDTEIHAAVVWDGTPNEQALLSHCSHVVDRRAIPRSVTRLPALPRNAGGKLLRHKLAVRYLYGSDR